jgi:hypothetical protein
MGLALTTLLTSGSMVVVRGNLWENRTADQLKAAVRWCIAKTDGTFRAGLEFLDNRSALTLDEGQTNSVNLETLDCYEVMQLSPNADADTISRVYRMLAFRWHPDNTETGNGERFLRLSAAHHILGDPEKRANYDLQIRDAQRLRGKHLDQWEKRGSVEVVTEAYLGVISLGRIGTQEGGCWEG